MALHAASSITGFVGPGGCAHHREVVKPGGTDDEPEQYASEFVVDCKTCEPILATMKAAWGPVNKPAPLTGDELDLLEAQQADANRSLLAGLAQLPDVLKGLVLQNQEVVAAIQALKPVENTVRPNTPRQPRQGQKR